VLVGVFTAITIELCGVKSLSFAVGLYLPLSTTAPIFAGGALKGLVDWRSRRRGGQGESELGPGNLYATGLVAGGALAGVLVAMFGAFDGIANKIAKLSVEHNLVAAIGQSGYELLGVIAFAIMAGVLYRTSQRRQV
jgi:hypothetical protein